MWSTACFSTPKTALRGIRQTMKPLAHKKSERPKRREKLGWSFAKGWLEWRPPGAHAPVPPTAAILGRFPFSQQIVFLFSFARRYSSVAVRFCHPSKAAARQPKKAIGYSIIRVSCHVIQIAFGSLNWTASIERFFW